MSDRTSAALFADFFVLLAKSPTDEHKAMARELWPKRADYDFSDYQMSADAALVKLGLAKRVRRDGEMCVVYADYDGTGWKE